MRAKVVVCLEASRRQARRSEQLSRQPRARLVPLLRRPRLARRARHRLVAVARLDLRHQRPRLERARPLHLGQLPRRLLAVAGPLGPRPPHRSVRHLRLRLSGQAPHQHSAFKAPRQRLEQRQPRPHRRLEGAPLVPRSPRQRSAPPLPHRHLVQQALRRPSARRAPRLLSDHRRRRLEEGRHLGVPRLPRHSAPALLQPSARHLPRLRHLHSRLEARRPRPSHRFSSTLRPQPHRRLAPLQALAACPRPPSARPTPPPRLVVEGGCSGQLQVRRLLSRRVRPSAAWERQACSERHSRGRRAPNRRVQA